MELQIRMLLIALCLLLAIVSWGVAEDETASVDQKEKTRSSQILKLTGDSKRGKQVFSEKSAELKCLVCHRVGESGGDFGTDLTHIGKNRSRANILESILEPSKRMSQKFLLLEMKDGRLIMGLLVSKNEKELVLKTAPNEKSVRVLTEQISQMQTSNQSPMSAQLTQNLSAKQIADLVEYLHSLK